MTAVTITRTGGLVEFKSKYDAGVVGIIKDVPREFRSFDSATKIWCVDDAYADGVIEALTQAGHFIGDTAIAPQAKTFWTGMDDPSEEAFHRATEILREIPPDEQGAVFRAMARILYPDLYRRTS